MYDHYVACIQLQASRQLSERISPGMGGRASRGRAFLKAWLVALRHFWEGRRVLYSEDMFNALLEWRFHKIHPRNLCLDLTGAPSLGRTTRVARHADTWTLASC